MAEYGVHPSLLDHGEGQGPFNSSNSSGQSHSPNSADRDTSLLISTAASSTDPLSTLESLDDHSDLDPDDRFVSPADHRGSPGSVGVFAGKTGLSSNAAVSSDPLSPLDQLEEIGIGYYDSLNGIDSFGERLEPQSSRISESSAPYSSSGCSSFAENGELPSVIVDNGTCDQNREMIEDPGAKPVPNYMSVHRKQPQRSTPSPEKDERITSVVALEEEELPVINTVSNTNQSNQGLASLGYIEDGYSTISKYRDDGEEEGSDQPTQETGNGQSAAVLRERKSPSSDSSDSTARYSSCASAIDISTSRQKLLRDDKVRFGTLDPRKLEDVTPSKFVNGRYVNPWDTWQEPTFSNAMKFMCMRKDGGIPSSQTLDQTLPVLIPDPLKIRAPPPSGINVTWIGHASLLVQFDGVSILTDPIFSNFCGPTSLVGVKRYRPAPCDVHMLPKIDAVVISHTHYDHLDLPTVQALNVWYGSSLRWFVPLGVMDWFTKTGVENVIELDWWQENCIPSHSDVTFAFTPSQHWSQRTAFDRQKCLWGSWSVIGPNHSFFFAGDTGYCKAFQEIGQRYGPFDLAAIPIGAYKPRFFLSPQHVDPAQAVQIHVDVQARQSVAIHWGTFVLGKEHYLAPKEDLKIALEEKGLLDLDFFTMKHGETRLVASEDDITP